MIPNTGAVDRSMCTALVYAFTKVWNAEAGRRAFRDMGCKPVGYQNGERIFKITADFVDRKGLHWRFDGLFDSSGYSTFTERTRG